MQSLKSGTAEETMVILRAKSMGFCFGMREAMARLRGIVRPGQVAIHGRPISNERIRRDLESLGFAPADFEDERIKQVLIPAHGVSGAERKRIEAAGKRVLDATCPALTHAQRSARRLEELNYHVLVVGRRGDAGLAAMTGDLRDHEVVEDPGQVRRYDRRRLAIVCQTTITEGLARAVRKRVRELNPGAEVHFVDTICQPMRDRASALEELLDRVEALIVVGGRESAESGRLLERSFERGVPALQVEDAADLDPDWFNGFRVVGLTADTSTERATIDAVHAALIAIAAQPA